MASRGRGALAGSCHWLDRMRKRNAAHSLRSGSWGGPEKGPPRCQAAPRNPDVASTSRSFRTLGSVMEILHATPAAGVVVS